VPSDGIRRAGQVAWAAIGLIGVAVVLGVVAWYLRVVWPPLVLAGAIVFILNPVVGFLQRRHVPRALGTAAAYLGVLCAAGLSALLIAPLAQRQADELADEWPKIRDNLEQDVNDLAERSEAEDWPVQIPHWDDLGDSFGTRDQTFEEQLETARELGLRVFHVAIIFVLGPIIAFYLLVDLPHIQRVAESLIPAERRLEAQVIGRRLARAIGGYFRGQLVVALIVATMVSIGLAIVGLPFWLLVGMIAGLFNMVPLIGPYIGGIPGVVIAFTTEDDGGLTLAVWVVVIMVVAQQIDNHFITPNVMQRAVKLHPAVVMLALLAGGTLFGFFGLLLAVPATAVLKIVIGHLWRTYVLGEPIELLAAEAEAADAGGGVVEDVIDREPPETAAAPVTPG
jgi:predicted PurR-regulated permease PerM